MKEKKKEKKTNKILEAYNKKQLVWKTHIRFEQNKFKRFWKWVWFYVAFPWCWVFYNIRDWRTAIIFAIVFLAVSSEVWIPYLLGIILHNAWLMGIGTACWLFWLGPGTPFMVICIAITIGVKTLWNKITNSKN